MADKRAGNDPRSQPSVGRVGKYLLLDLLGEGAFGKVRLAVDQNTGLEYAIKIMEKSLIQAKELTLQVRREIAVMKAMRHRNIVNLHQVLTSSNNLYMVMDLVTGGELFDAVAENDRLTEPTARLYFQQLVDGVNYCHSRRVYHRDLKPENLLLSEDKKTLKITDFGLSSIKAINASSELLHTIMGSPHYIAPEIITSAAEGYDGAKVDVWASGVILFGMLAGYLPFDKKNTRALYKAIVEDAVKYPSHFSYDVIKLLKAMLNKEAGKRPTMEQVKTYTWFKVNYNGNSEDTDGKSGEKDKKRLRTKLRKHAERAGRRRRDKDNEREKDTREAVTLVMDEDVETPKPIAAGEIRKSTFAEEQQRNEPTINEHQPHDRTPSEHPAEPTEPHNATEVAFATRSSVVEEVCSSVPNDVQGAAALKAPPPAGPSTATTTTGTVATTAEDLAATPIEARHQPTTGEYDEQENVDPRPVGTHKADRPHDRSNHRPTLMHRIASSDDTRGAASDGWSGQKRGEVGRSFTRLTESRTRSSESTRSFTRLSTVARNLRMVRGKQGSGSSSGSQKVGARGKIEKLLSRVPSATRLGQLVRADSAKSARSTRSERDGDVARQKSSDANKHVQVHIASGEEGEGRGWQWGNNDSFQSAPKMYTRVEAPSSPGLLPIIDDCMIADPPQAPSPPPPPPSQQRQLQQHQRYPLPWPHAAPAQPPTLVSCSVTGGASSVDKGVAFGKVFSPLSRHVRAAPAASDTSEQSQATADAEGLSFLTSPCSQGNDSVGEGGKRETSSGASAIFKPIDGSIALVLSPRVEPRPPLKPRNANEDEHRESCPYAVEGGAGEWCIDSNELYADVEEGSNSAGGGNGCDGSGGEDSQMGVENDEQDDKAGDETGDMMGEEESGQGVLGKVEGEKRPIFAPLNSRLQLQLISSMDVETTCTKALRNVTETRQ